jgi:hypothetical protein
MLDFKSILSILVISIPFLVLILIIIFFTKQRNARLSEELGKTPIHEEIDKNGRISIYEDFIIISSFKRLLLRFDEITGFKDSTAGGCKIMYAKNGHQKSFYISDLYYNIRKILEEKGISKN